MGVYKNLQKVSVIAGYKGLGDITIRLFLPIILVITIFSISIFMFVDILPWFTGPLVFLVGVISAIMYPYISYLQAKQNINDRLHLFITYSGTISTMKISRSMLFKKIATSKNFGEISNIFEKIVYLAKKWNLGYAPSTRIMVKKTASPILADFLDRLAVIMDFGQDLEVFFFDEQEAIINDYGVIYRQSLETIKMLQEVFISLSISFAFLIGIALLAPLLLDLRLETVLLYAMIGLTIFYVGLVLAIKSLIPADKLTLYVKEANKEMKKVVAFFYLTLVMSLLLCMILLIATDLELIFVFAISSLPLLYPSILASREEEEIMRRDSQFPIYVRVLGSAIEVRNGGVISALKSTQTHEFGALNDMSINLYRRLRVGSEKLKCWYHFAKETGSNLISNFTKIFQESVYLGGDAEKIGEIVSNNMTKLINLRKLRYQLSGSLRASFYGAMIGITSTIYVSAKISQLLVEIFTQPFLEVDDAVGLVDVIVPQADPVNFSLVMIYIAFIIVVQAGTGAYMMKLIDGGSPYASLLDFIIMLWIGAALSYMLPGFVDTLLPTIEDLTLDTEI